MRLVWDEAKRLANLDKHGFDFADAIFFGWEDAMIVRTHSRRLKAIGRFEDGMAAVVYAELGMEALSIISFRPASARERKALE